MLTRIHVKGFKNLLDTEVLLGPFTCIAGPNGVGKSNLFDAIMFLRDLADFTIVEAASRVRDRTGKRRGDIRSLFTSTHSNQLRDIEFDVEFLVPKKVRDDFDRETSPSATHLRYKVALRYISQDPNAGERIELVHESLTYIQKRESRKRLGFPNSPTFWNSIIGEARRAEFISTELSRHQTIIKLRQDGGRGRALEVPAAGSPRTVLGTINTDDKPTALAARREMQSWTFLQLEPSQLRLPDDFSAEDKVSPDGAHMAATLDRLGSHADIANKLSQLLPDVVDVAVDVDEGRRLKTLVVKNHDGMIHTARSLSDGTLRFLALAIIGADNRSGGVICLEEPENGIHPSRIQSMIELLKDIAVDPLIPVNSDNPLRQVIINTHSPLVVQSLPTTDLLVCLAYKAEGTTVTTFAAIEDTWRTKKGVTDRPPRVPLSALMFYLTEEPGTEKNQDGTDQWSIETVRKYAERQGVFDFMRATSQ